MGRYYSKLFLLKLAMKSFPMLTGLIQLHSITGTCASFELIGKQGVKDERGSATEQKHSRWKKKRDNRIIAIAKKKNDTYHRKGTILWTKSELDWAWLNLRRIDHQIETAANRFFTAFNWSAATPVTVVWSLLWLVVGRWRCERYWYRFACWTASS